MTDSRWTLPDRLPPAEDVDLLTREDLLTRHPAPEFADAVRTRRRPFGWFPAAGLATAGALAVALLIVAAPWEHPGTAPGTTDPAPEDAAFGALGTHRPKSTQRPITPPDAGPVDLSVVALRDGRPVTLEDGAHLAPDTRIRFLYDSTDYDYLMLVSITDRGEVSILYPMTEGSSIQVVRGRGIPLHGAVQLDDHLGPERFFALFSPSPMIFEQVETAIAESRRSAATLEGAAWLRGLQRLPLGCAQATLLIEKDSTGETNDG